ncbi:MAG: DUF4270 domain-containing protein [Chitinophagaceae bacterium]
MNNRYFFLRLIAIVTTVAIVFSACKKINEATELGGGLIPPVDGITTLDTTVSLQTFNDTFTFNTDSQYYDKNKEFFLGKLDNDPLFGKTDARMFLELKPALFPFYFNNTNPDSLFIDSVVLLLNHVENYGDSTIPQTVNVYEIDPIPANNFKSDSNYLIRQEHFTYTNLLGSRTFTPASLNDTVKAFKDTTTHQLRIRLDNSFGSRLLSYDSVKTSFNGAYANDSIFKSKLRGFVVKSVGNGNALMGFDLNGFNTALAIYYRYDKRTMPTVPNIDTTVVYFPFSNSFCAAANYVKRDFAGSPLAAAVGGTTQDPLVYIQSTPGSYADIKIPDLATLDNRLVHRAELIVEQVYDASDEKFGPPGQLYLDASDPTISAFNKHRVIPYDLQLLTGGSLNFGDFGSTPIDGTDGSGHAIKIWKFNITRYVQHVLNGTLPLYDLRLFAPYSLLEQYGIPPASDITVKVGVNKAIAKGRVRVGGGNHPTQRMRLRIIYSKL